MFSIAIHGGAGTIRKEAMTAEQEKNYHQVLTSALNAGYEILKKAGDALDAVAGAVIILEDNALFNAGKGSVFTADKTHEMDASIMCGKTLAAGAVCGVKNVRNPINLAKAVIKNSDHVFLSGEGAANFARHMGLTFESDDYFYTQHRYDQLMDAQQNAKVQLDHSDKKFGTVGAVALDSKGNLAAATSTGGLTNKKYGRVGDTPVIGAGTYANNQTCAVSCTGEGEYFIRTVAAYDVSCLMEYKGLSLREACHLVIQEKLPGIGGEGGLIAMDSQGNIALVFNSEGMYRGWRKQGEEPVTEIFK